MEEVPTQHLLFPTLNKVLCCVRHGKESELPVVVQVGAGHFGRIAVAREDVLGEYNLLHDIWVFYGERSGKANALVVGEDVYFVDGKVVQDGFQVCAGSCGGVVSR